ncbi:sigma 54-interacting transcriptional regulator [bacterium]|nr:sigma 54-interacting transcriptional regulator [candidate division CSSED10-310 bacterium]
MNVIAGKYHVEKILGTGGGGVVYACRNDAGNPVAIKEIHAAASVSLEVQALARLRHPNIVRLYDWFIDREKSYLVMELVDGVHLRTCLEESGCPGSERRSRVLWNIIPQVLQAMDYLHGRGVVHGDIKPQNILVDRSGKVKITDFGLSRIGPHSGSEGKVFAGTVQYASPEQCRGAVPDIRSDLYSLGVVLYEAVSGILPFEGRTFYELLLKQVKERPRSLMLIKQESSLERVILWLLEKDPADRLPSAREIWSVLTEKKPDCERSGKVPDWEAPAELFRPAFMGRGDELKRLGDILAPEDGSGRKVCFLKGEAGIGKSRLLEEFELLKGWEGVAVLPVFAGAGHGLPLDVELQPVLGRMEQYRGRMTPEDAKRLNEGVGRSLSAFPGWESFQDPGAEIGTPPKAFGRLIGNLAEMRPVLIWIDDVDRMSASRIRFFRSALSGLKRIAVVMSMDEAAKTEASETAEWISEIRSSGQTIRLDGLPVDHMAALVRSMLGTMELPEPLLDRIIKRSGGNPGLAQELVMNAFQSGALAYRENRWHLAPKKWRYRAGSYRSNMLARLRNLSHEALTVMEALAVSDPIREISPVCGVAGMNPQRFLDVLDELGKSGLLRRFRSELTVRHWAFLELIYNRMPARRRRDLHDTVAEYLISHAAPDQSEIARHLSRGYHPETALPYYLKAIERLQEHAQYAAVTELAKDALRIRMQDTEPAVLGVLRHMGIAQRALGNLQEAQDAYRKLNDAAGRTGVIDLQMEALFGLAGILYSTGKTGPALDRFNQAAALCVQNGNLTLEARCRLGAGVCNLALGDYDTALEEAVRAREIFNRLNSPMSVARSLQLMGDIYHETGRFPQAREINEEALRIFQDSGQVEHSAACLMSIGRTLMEQGRIGQAEQLFLQAMKIAENARHFMIENITRVNLAGALIEKGEPWKAVRELDKALEILDRIGFPKTVADGRKKLAVACEIVGDISRAEQEYQRALEIYRNQGDKRGEADCLVSMGKTRLNQGQLKQAKTFGESVRAIAREIPDPLLAAEAYDLLAKVNILTGNTSSGVRYLRAAGKLNRSFNRRHREGRVLVELGFVRLDAGNLAEAAKLFERSRQILDPLGITGGMLRVLRGLVELSVRMKDAAGQMEAAGKLQALMQDIDDHSAIPHLFFRVDLPTVRSPLGDMGARLAGHIVRSSIFKDSPVSVFALSTIAASVDSPEKSLDLYRKAESLAKRFKMRPAAERIDSAIRLLSPAPGQTETEKTGSIPQEGTKKMKTSDSAPIQFLLHSTREFFTATDLNRLLTSVLDQVVEATGGERGFLMTRGPEGDLHFSISRNIRQEDISEPEFETSRTIINHVVETKRTYLSGDVGADTAFRERRSIQILGLRSILCVPIPGNQPSDQVKGLIYLDNTLEQGLFSFTDRLLVEIVAELASVALENVKNREALEATRLALNEENLRLKEELGKRYRMGMLIGRSSAMDKVIGIAGRVAASNASVLISGDTGTGKEIVAKTIHFNSPRKQCSFIGINCAALPENLLEAELFGIEKGVATGVNARIGLVQKADRGTLFLDEIADMNPATQAKILRVLQEREVTPIGGRTPRKVDVRIISATNQDLKKRIRDGTFREDLYYRLNVIHIDLPPLRQRKEDILPLARHFLEQYSREIKRKFDDFNREAMAAMVEYSWPGNVRELENAIQRATILETGNQISLEALPAEIGGAADRSGGAEPAVDALISGMNLKSNMERIEKHLVSKALEQANGVKKEAAGILGITPRILSYYLKKHGFN